MLGSPKLHFFLKESLDLGAGSGLMTSSLVLLIMKKYKRMK